MHVPIKPHSNTDKLLGPQTGLYKLVPVVLRLSGIIAGSLRGVLVTVLMGSLQAYKLLISPLLGSRCRFHPSCSIYAQQSIERFGPVAGCWLALKRLVRCGPWHPGGIDEIPELIHQEASCGCERQTSSSLNILKSS